MTNLFHSGTFTSAAGLSLTWKIECDVLTDDDWATIAEIASATLPPFRTVLGVPRGGLKLAAYLNRYSSKRGTVLLVDDVWTTGKSMLKFSKQVPSDWHGFVAFARGDLPTNVSCFMQTCC